MTRVERYQDRSGRWRWRAKSPNGLIIADSGQGYRTKWGAKRAALRSYPDGVIT